MKKISIEIPKEQKQILLDALNLLEVALKSLDNNEVDISYKLFDILTLKAMLNQTSLIINLPFDLYENFAIINGIDFPNYK